MELKPGYKLTEVGVIPEDWDVRKLPEVSWFQEGPGLRNWQFTGSGMKVINITNLENGVLNLERTDRYISITEFNQTYKHFAIDAADILMASSGNSYGKTSVVRHEDLPLVMNTSVIRFKPIGVIESNFLWAILNAPLFKNQIDLMITGGAQPNFGPYHLKRVNVPLPPLPEQRSIATALSDMDELLGGLDRLITKKRDLKQSAMQQLLTGKTRLLEFGEGKGYKQTELGLIPEDWEIKKLGTVTSYRNGVAHEQSINESGKFVVVNSKFISTEGLIRKYSNDCFCLAAIDDVLMVMSDVPNGRAIAKCFWVESDNTFTINQRVCILSPCNVNGKLLFYKLDRNPFYLAFDDGAKQTNLRKSDVLSCPLVLPMLVEEQTAIASILSDMDTEIATLEQRRNKTRDLKQAMMQELLTGRIRLL